MVSFLCWLSTDSRWKRGEGKFACEEVKAMYLHHRILLFSALAFALGALAINCGSESSTSPDTTAPAAITDLGIQSTGCDNVSLAWTAPGDDGNDGKASSYDLRWDDATITEATWASATPCQNEPAPKTAGGAEVFTVSSLEPDTTYYFAIKTRDDNANESALSNVCHTLVGSPAIAWVKDGLGSDEDWVASVTQLSANWADAECADEYEYALGTTQGGTDVVGWTSVGTETHVTRTSLTLADDHIYYFSARGIAGTTHGSPNSSDGVTVDITAPTSSVAPLPAEELTLIFTVSWDGNDATSGIKHCDIQVKDGAGEWTGWLEATALTSSDYTGVDGHIYYFRSRAWDNAGNVEAYPATADAQTTVNLAGKPQVAWVRDGLFAEADWTNSTTALSAKWAAAAGGDGYEYAIGTAAGGTDIVDWTSAGTATQVTHSGLALTVGPTYYFSVRVVVGAAHGNAVSSDGITVDITPPTSAVHPLPPVTTTERFLVTWVGRDDASGILAYNFQCKDGDGEWGDAYGWNPATSFDGFPGEDGHTYYFRTRAFDNAGNAEAFPDVPDAQTTVDLPVIPDIDWVNDGLGADEDWTNGQIDAEGGRGLSANWAGAPGVDGYECALGTAPGDSTFDSWRSAGSDNFYTIGESDVLEGPTFYFSVRGVIGSRHGDPTSSNGVRVDMTSPTSSVDSLALETNTLMFNVSWSGEDTLSGINHYDIQVRDGGGDLDEYEDWLVGTTLTSTDFTGEDGHTYYFQSRATDNVGNEEDYHASADAWTTVRCTYVFVRKWGTLGSGNGEFDIPMGVTVDASGNVFVTERNNDRIQKFTPDGDYLAQVGSSGQGDGELEWPLDVAVDDSGYIYVADSYHSRIEKFTSAGTFAKKWGTFGTAEGEMHQPFALDVDDSGYVYVLDTGNKRVQKFTSQGVFVTAWGDSGSGASQFSDPRGLAVDGAGIVYVADAHNRTIQKFTSNGTRLGGWGSPGGGDGQLNYPYAIDVDDSGYVYVADTFNHRIQVFTSGGDFVAKWGSLGSGDGEFNYPQGVAVSDSGYIYTVEPNANRIQKFRWSCP